MDVTSVCIVCLANKDKTELLPLGEFENLYETLAGKNKFAEKKLFSCSSCCEFFSKILEFQKKIQSAEVILTFDNDLENNTISEIKYELVTEYASDDNFYDEPLIEEAELNIENDVKFDNDAKSENDIKSDNDESVTSLNSHTLNNEICIKSKPNTVEPLIYRKKNKKVWSDKAIDDFIKKHHMPFDRKYVKKLLHYRNMKYKAVYGVELYRTKFDLVVDTQVCADEEEVREVMEKSRSQDRFSTRKIKCNKCVLAFKGTKSLRAHIIENHAKTLGPYACEFCGTRSSNKESMEAHRRGHYKKYVCRVCWHTECNESRMSEHIRYKRKLYQCPQCEQCFGVVGQFYHHYKSIHLSFICDYCQKTFRDKLWFEKHIIANHMSHRCPQCPKVYPNYSQLKKHMRYAHVEEAQSERTYCVECDRHFRSRVAYKHHLYSTRHKPPAPPSRHPCQECGASFHRACYLRRHIDHAHLGRSAHQCDQCSKRFVIKSQLRRHVLFVHEKVKPPKNKKCHYCDLAFSTRRILTHHIRTHTGEKPHQCPLCDVAFAQKVALHAHIKSRHTGAGAAPDLAERGAKHKQAGAPEPRPRKKTC